jgi:hypothetical protein
MNPILDWTPEDWALFRKDFDYAASEVDLSDELHVFLLELLATIPKALAHIEKLGKKAPPGQLAALFALCEKHYVQRVAAGEYS